jgi:transcription elongation factor Elf1
MTFESDMTMNITKSTTSITCPRCRNTSTYELSPHELADGRKLVCGKCGREIVIDPTVFEKTEEILGHLPTSSLFSMTTVTKSSMCFQCPRCQKTTTTDMTIGGLVDGEKVFCSHCGNEIHADGAKILQADAALRGIATPSGGSEAKTFNTPEGPVVVKRKTFNVDLKTNIDIGKTARPGAGGLAGGTPILTPRRAIEPKKGCLGVVATVAFLGMIVLLYGFLV